MEALAARGATLNEMAAALDRSTATVRHWLARWEIERAPRQGRRPADPSTAPRIVEMRCGQHEMTDFVLERRGTYRCRACRQEHVSEWRRRVKRTLVAEAGGRCRCCGYDACAAALEFHHVDPATKSFALSHAGLARSLTRARVEAAKCVLRCATCHAEVEAGFRPVPPEWGSARTTAADLSV